jgi:hypothetical protein
VGGRVWSKRYKVLTFLKRLYFAATV